MTHNKVLLFQIGSIGDTVVSVPAFRAVQAHFGEGTEYWALSDRQETIPYGAADVLGLTGEIKDFLPYRFSRSWLGRRVAGLLTLQRLRVERFDAAVYLAPAQRAERSVRRDRAFFGMAGIQTLLGFCAFPKSELYPVDSDGHPAEVKQEGWFRLERLRRDGVAVDSDSALRTPFLRPAVGQMEAVRGWLAANRRHQGRAIVAIAPGGKQPANRWPLDRFIAVGKKLLATDAVELVVIGGDAERAAAGACVAEWGSGLNSAGCFNVGETLALLAECSLLIGLDTGTTHLAAAAGIPCVGIYSDKDNPGRWHPLGANHVVLRNRVPCGGCRLINKPCPVSGHPCLGRTSVDDVCRAVERITDGAVKFR